MIIAFNNNQFVVSEVVCFSFSHYCTRIDKVLRNDISTNLC